MKNKILLFGPLPPIYTGQSISFSYVVGILEIDNVLIINTQKYSSKFLSFLYSQIKTFQIFFSNSIDTLYLTNSRTKLGFYREFWVLLISKLLGIRVIIHLHGSDFKTFYNSNYILKPIIKFLYQNISTSIVLLEGMKKEFEQFPKMDVRVLPNCYDPIYEDESVDYNAKNGVLYLSNIMYTKGIIVFMSSLEKVLHETNSNVIIAGEFIGDYVMSKQEIMKLFYSKLEMLNNKFPNRVKYIGVIKGKEKMSVLKKSALFCLPTFYKTEAFPLSILEAMAMGNAVVSTRHNFIPEFLTNKNGRLIEPNNELELANTLISLIKGQDLLKIQKYNFTYSRQNYSFQNFEKSIRQVLLTK